MVNHCSLQKKLTEKPRYLLRPTQTNHTFIFQDFQFKKIKEAHTLVGLDVIFCTFDFRLLQEWFSVTPSISYSEEYRKLRNKFIHSTCDCGCIFARKFCFFGKIAILFCYILTAFIGANGVAVPLQKHQFFHKNILLRIRQCILYHQLTLCASVRFVSTPTEITLDYLSADLHRHVHLNEPEHHLSIY